MHWLLLLVFGLGVGIFSGLLGIGGGVILVPGLMFLFGLTQIEAQGTSLAVLSLPILLLAAWEYYRQGQVHLPTAAFIAAGFCVGALLGARVVEFMPVSVLRVAFGMLLLYLGWTMLLVPVEPQPPVADGSNKVAWDIKVILAGVIAIGNGVGLLWYRKWRGQRPGSNKPLST